MKKRSNEPFYQSPFYKTSKKDVKDMALEEIRNAFEIEVLKFREDEVEDEFNFCGGPKGAVLLNIERWLIPSKDKFLMEKFEKAIPELKNIKSFKQKVNFEKMVRIKCLRKRKIFLFLFGVFYLFLIIIGFIFL